MIQLTDYDIEILDFIASNSPTSEEAVLQKFPSGKYGTKSRLEMLEKHGLIDFPTEFKNWDNFGGFFTTGEIQITDAGIKELTDFRLKEKQNKAVLNDKRKLQIAAIVAGLIGAVIGAVAAIYSK